MKMLRAICRKNPAIEKREYRSNMETANKQPTMAFAHRVASLKMTNQIVSAIARRKAKGKITTLLRRLDRRIDPKLLRQRE